jgi:phage tail protein X
MRVGFLSALCVASVVVVAPAFAEESTSYVVKPGDTCATIARRAYGDATRVDLIHGANPGWGAPPHALKVGQVIVLPPKPKDAAAAAQPDARLSRVKNRVEVKATEPRPGKPNDPLYRGNRVSTQEESSAEVMFADESQLRLAEKTLIVVLGAVRGAAQKLTASDTVLETGALRVHLSDIAGKKSAPVPIATPSAQARVSGDVQISVDGNKATRVASYKGTTDVTAQRKTVVVPASYGTKVEPGKAPTPPKKLPVAPEWTQSPEALVLSMTGASPRPVSVALRAGTGELAPVRSFHVQIGTDTDFGDVVRDVTLPGDAPSFSVSDLAPGSYLIQASAIDSDGFEGIYTPATTFVVGRVELSNEGHRRDTVRVLPDVVHCAVGDAPPQASLQLDRADSSSLRCTTAGAAPVAVAIPARPIGLRIARASLARSEGDNFNLTLAVTDGDLGAFSSTSLRGVALIGADGKLPLELHAGSEPGVFLTSIKLPKGTGSFRVSASTDVEEAPAVVVDAPVEAAAPVAAEVAAAPRRSPSTFEAHLGVGPSAVGTESSFVGLGARLGVGYRREAGPFVLGIAVQGLYEGYGSQTVDGSVGGSSGRVAVTNLQVAGGAIPVSVGYGNLDSRFMPYISVSPALLLESGKFSPASGPTEDTSSGLIAVRGSVGLELRAGPGDIYGEAGYRLSGDLGTVTARESMRGAVMQLGYRLFLWR